MTQELYVYTTRSYEKKDFFKIGQCELGRFKVRIREQFGTSNPEQPVPKWRHDLPDGITDHHVHKQLIKNGFDRAPDTVGREWFEAPLHEIKRAFNEVCYGSSRLESYSLRKEQAAAVEKALQWFEGKHEEHIIDGAIHKDRFLLNAKMRFGKCFTGIHVAKALKAKRCLIVTYKPEVISEWMSAVNDHVDFEGWLGVRARGTTDHINDPHLNMDGSFPDHSGPMVVCVSLQDLSISADGETKKRLSKVVKTDWDLIIFDEVHFGSKTDRAKFIIENPEEGKGLVWRKRLDLSGTPFRLIQEDDFCAQQVFTYSYLDEQDNKKLEIRNDPSGSGFAVYRQMPDLDVSTIEITDEDIKEQREKFVTDDLDFSLNELFRVSKGSFVHDRAIDHFIDGLAARGHTARSVSIFGTLGEQLGTPAIRHTVWWLNRVDAVKALSKKLRGHPYFSRFEIINAAGGKAKGDESADYESIVKDKLAIQKKIKSSANDPTKLGTITLTVRRFLTGVTIKEWDSILVLNDVKSPESYFQAIFRVQSAWYDPETETIKKPKSWVFDFAVSRCLRLTFHYADALADQLDQQDSVDRVINDNIQRVTDGLCETLDIKRFYEGSLKSDPTTSKDIFDAINFSGSRISLAKRITSDALVNFISLKHLEAHPALFDALKRVKGYRTQDVGGIDDFLQIGRDADELDKKKKEVRNEEELEVENEEFVEKEEDKDKKSRKKWYATQIKRLAICMADFIYMTKFREHKIDHVIETEDSDFFQIVTGITKDEFKQLCDLGFVSQHALNRIVREFRCQEESSLLPEEYIHSHLNRPVLKSFQGEILRVDTKSQTLDKELNAKLREQSRSFASKKENSES